MSTPKWAQMGDGLDCGTREKADKGRRIAITPLSRGKKHKKRSTKTTGKARCERTKAKVCLRLRHPTSVILPDQGESGKTRQLFSTHPRERARGGLGCAGCAFLCRHPHGSGQPLSGSDQAGMAVARTRTEGLKQERDQPAGKTGRSRAVLGRGTRDIQGVIRPYSEVWTALACCWCSRGILKR